MRFAKWTAMRVSMMHPELSGHAAAARRWTAKPKGKTYLAPDALGLNSS